MIDELRANEYARLDVGGHIYLDYTGGGLYADSQLERHNHLLAEHVFGNPHSSNPTSQAATQLVEHAREYVLKFFNADPDEYLAIFTSNASGALKLVGEFISLSQGTLHVDVRQPQLCERDSGIRACTRCGSDLYPHCLARYASRRFTTGPRTGASLPENGHNLFAYPAQSNFSSVKHPLEWIEKAHKMAGMFCSMWRHLSRPINWISVKSSLISSRSRFIRCLVIQQEWAC